MDSKLHTFHVPYPWVQLLSTGSGEGGEQGASLQTIA